MAKKTKGRQKVEMVKMSNEKTLQAIFSKRRYGLFKKASELCTLCGIEVAIIVFSPSNKVFSFGHPCVEFVLDNFLTRRCLGSLQPIQGHGHPHICELNLQLTQVLDELEIEKKRGDELIEMRKASQSQCWWEAPIEELDPFQLAELKVHLEALKENVTVQAQKVVFQSSDPSQYFGEGSSSGGVIQVHPYNTGFNPSNYMVPPPPPPPPPIQSSAHSRHFVGNSSTEGVIPTNPINVMPPPPPPPPHQHQPPQHPCPHSRLSKRFYEIYNWLAS